ncbi:M20/M25/M40 family metallo-hydrolase [Chryseobacterium lathyri]|nr:M20/M25/M40 family metallo-hydrolase [Chryseobacterium lathyri]
MRKKTLFMVLSITTLVVSCKKSNKTPQISSTSIEQFVDKNTTWRHLEDIQKIADKNQNHRSIGSSGGIATANYIVGQLELLGLKPIKLPFEIEGRNNKKIKGQNIVVEILGKSDKVVMFGAHYDSVEIGPGINDNATGVAILLELVSAARKMNIQPEKTIHIAFWDAEEEGVLGSASYIKQLSEQEKKRINSYINVDMVGIRKFLFWMEMEAAFNNLRITLRTAACQRKKSMQC